MTMLIIEKYYNNYNNSNKICTLVSNFQSYLFMYNNSIFKLYIYTHMCVL